MQDIKNRIQYIDIAKGIAIILMVLGHKGIPQWLSNFIWSFHMPLFFICFGIVANFTRNSLAEFTLRRLKTLIFPFIIYSIIVYGLYQFTREPISLHHLLTSGWGGYALWFIPVLFVSSIWAKITFFFSGYYRCMFAFAYLVIGCILCHCNICLPWAMSSTPFATFLIVAGTELKGTAVIVEKQRSLKLLITVLILFVYNALISHYWRLDICANIVLPIIPLTIGSITGTFMVFAISTLICRYTQFVSGLLTIVGRETYIIVAFSQIIIPFVNLTGFEIPFVVKNLILIIVLIILTLIKNFIKKMIGQV